jgi:hypothetical protein
LNQTELDFKNERSTIIISTTLYRTDPKNPPIRRGYLPNIYYFLLVYRKYLGTTSRLLGYLESSSAIKKPKWALTIFLAYLFEFEKSSLASLFIVAPPEDPNSALKIRLWDIEVFFAKAGSPQFTHVLKWPQKTRLRQHPACLQILEVGHM